MDKAPVSVVIPAFNSEDVIAEAIQSVHAQTLPVAEVIVVDDGSTDDTADVAAKLGARVIRRPHRGISAARNGGISEARYEWIAFLDADDVWMPQKTERQWGAITRHPDVGLVTCDLIQCRDVHSSEEICGYAPSNTDDLISYVPYPGGDFLRNRMNYNSPTMLIRKDILFSVGLFNEQVHFVEGVECYLRVIARCPIAMVEQALVKQRLHDLNTSLNHIDMSLAWIRMLDAIRSQPEDYPPGAFEAMGLGVSEAVIPLARACLGKGRRHEARKLLVRSLRQRFSRRAIMLWGLTFATPVVFNRMLAIKRRVGCIVRTTTAVPANDQS